MEGGDGKEGKPPPEPHTPNPQAKPTSENNHQPRSNLMDAPRYAPSSVSTTAPKHLPHLVPPLGPPLWFLQRERAKEPANVHVASGENCWQGKYFPRRELCILTSLQFKARKKTFLSVARPFGANCVPPAATFHMSHLRRHWRPRSHKELLPGDQPGEKGQVCDLGPQKHNQDE